MLVKYLYLLVLCLGLSSAKSFFKSGLSSLVSQVASVTGVTDPFGFEKKIKTGLSELKQVVQNGDKRLNLPPLDPVTLRGHYFHLNDSENDLKGFFHNITVQGHSNYDAFLNKFGFFPQPTVSLQIIWPLIHANGFYNLSGYIFDNNSIDGSGEFDLKLENLKVSSEWNATLDQDWLQFTNINISYTIEHLRINYTDDSDSHSKILNETSIMGLADEAQHKYFPQLMDGLKGFLNSFLLKFNYRTLVSVLSTFI